MIQKSSKSMQKDFDTLLKYAGFKGVSELAKESKDLSRATIYNVRSGYTDVRQSTLELIAETLSSRGKEITVEQLKESLYSTGFIDEVKEIFNRKGSRGRPANNSIALLDIIYELTNFKDEKNVTYEELATAFEERGLDFNAKSFRQLARRINGTLKAAGYNKLRIKILPGLGFTIVVDEDAVRKLEQKNKNLRSQVNSQQENRTYFINVPFPNSFFTGRKNLLAHLREEFSKKDGLGFSHPQVISGLGGIGKTQLALQYVYLNRENYKYVFWINADTNVTLNSSLSEIADNLDLLRDNRNTPDAIADVVRVWLERNSDWLIVFDNADTPEILRDILPRIRNGHILITSRATNFGVFGIARPIRIEKLSVEEALHFIFDRTGRDRNDTEELSAARELVEELGCFPLALEQAGAFIQAKAVRFQDYLASYKEHNLQLLEAASPVVGEYSASIGTAWQMNLEQIKKNEGAISILKLSAFFAPDNIPFELITEGVSLVSPSLEKTFAGIKNKNLALTGLLEPLGRYSFIDLDMAYLTFNIHTLVQEVLRDSLGSQESKDWTEKAIRALNQIFPEPEFENWNLCKRLIPHGLAIIDRVNEYRVRLERIEEIGFLCGKLGAFLLQNGLYKAAEKVLETGSNQESIYNTNLLANIYRVQGRYEEAENLYRKTLNIQENTKGENHPDTATSLNNLAVLYDSQGRYEEAEVFYQKALDIRERILGLTHLDTVTSLNNLAVLYDSQGRYEEAEELYRKILNIQENALGENHLDTATSLNNLAALYDSQDRSEEAEVLYRKALNIQENALGENHPDAATSLNNLAVLYDSQDRYEEAEVLYRKALNIREKLFGKSHPLTIKIRDILNTLSNEKK